MTKPMDEDWELNPLNPLFEPTYEYFSDLPAPSPQPRQTQTLVIQYKSFVQTIMNRFSLIYTILANARPNVTPFYGRNFFEFFDPHLPLLPEPNPMDPDYERVIHENQIMKEINSLYVLITLLGKASSTVSPIYKTLLGAQQVWFTMNDTDFINFVHNMTSDFSSLLDDPAPFHFQINVDEYYSTVIKPKIVDKIAGKQITYLEEFKQFISKMGAILKNKVRPYYQKIVGGVFEKEAQRHGESIRVIPNKGVKAIDDVLMILTGILDLFDKVHWMIFFDNPTLLPVELLDSLHPVFGQENEPTGPSYHNPTMTPPMNTPSSNPPITPPGFLPTTPIIPPPSLVIPEESEDEQWEEMAREEADEDWNPEIETKELERSAREEATNTLEAEPIYSAYESVNNLPKIRKYILSIVPVGKSNALPIKDILVAAEGSSTPDRMEVVRKALKTLVASGFLPPPIKVQRSPDKKTTDKAPKHRVASMHYYSDHQYFLTPVPKPPTVEKQREKKEKKQRPPGWIGTRGYKGELTPEAKAVLGAIPIGRENAIPLILISNAMGVGVTSVYTIAKRLELTGYPIHTKRGEKGTPLLYWKDDSPPLVSIPSSTQQTQIKVEESLNLQVLASVGRIMGSFQALSIAH